MVAQQVVAEVAVVVAPHRVHVVVAVLGVVVLDEESLALHAVVVPLPRLVRARPPERHLLEARMGNKGKREFIQVLRLLEAIPMEVLSTIDVNWESMGQYMDKLDKRLGVNTGTLIGHTPLRYYVMGDDCQGDEKADCRIDRGDLFA